ncbi:hypothetical protein NQ314_001175 [Rhamnusium bicolor]|uniref:UPF3 domain-containing protein n=1 Tax=Rhamnusium bicolor TaxID=1586634 RepID=A0AAV8ZSG4_9CUCU|nr:hypothetical protein NQ314_001175 [Rhamnusium bicolor]
MDQETFLNQVSPIPDYNYIYTVRGDSSLGEYAFSRVYINFMNSDDIYNFKERFDNYVFLDSKGHEYPAVVEFASFQKIPKKRGKTRMDPKCGTIDTDPVYLDFVESLNKPQEQDEKPEYTLQLTNENKNDVTTPLLEYIKNKRAQRMRVREVRREERKSESKSQLNKPSCSKDEKGEGEVNTESKVEDKAKKGNMMIDEKEIKPRYPRKEYLDNRDYKRLDEYKEKDYRSKYDDYKKEPDIKAYPKKVKKYSERREERKIEVQKAEQKKLEHQAKDKESKAEENEFKSVENKKEFR